jgi:hypothetical protein
MFGGSFNDLSFNSYTDQEANIIDISVNLSGSSEATLDLNMEMTLLAHLSGQGEVIANYIREFDSKVDRMSGKGGTSATIVREMRPNVRLSGEGRISAVASKFHVDYLDFTGEFKPGDRITIDSGKYKITRNGENVSHLYGGDFFNLNLGTNNLTWTDTVTGRIILFRITHRDRFLY